MNQVEKCKKQFESWPSWMKKLAYWEGSDVNNMARIKVSTNKSMEHMAVKRDK